MKRLLYLSSSLFLFAFFHPIGLYAEGGPARPKIVPPEHTSTLEVAAKALFDWRDVKSEGRVIQLTFSEFLVPSEVGMALICQGVVCTGNSALLPKRSPNQPFAGPLLARVVSDLVGFDSTDATNSFKSFMTTADSMKSWENPCLQGNIFLNFTSTLREGFQGDRRTLYLVLYAPTRNVMTFSRSQPKFRLAWEKDILKADSVRVSSADGDRIMAFLLRAGSAECPRETPQLDGFVNVQVTIEPNGKVSKAFVAKTDLPTPYQDSAVQTALRTDWKPARNKDGLAVRSEATLPISFSCCTQPR